MFWAIGTNDNYISKDKNVTEAILRKFSLKVGEHIHINECKNVLDTIVSTNLFFRIHLWQISIADNEMKMLKITKLQMVKWSPDSFAHQLLFSSVAFWASVAQLVRAVTF